MLQQTALRPAGDFTLANLIALPSKLDDATYHSVDRFARSQPTDQEPCPRPAFAKAIAMLDASLPKAASDDLTGELRLEAYHRKLGHLPREAVGEMVSRALERCKWFPTIAELLEIIDGWVPEGDRARRMARAIIARHPNPATWGQPSPQQTLDDARAKLKRGKLDQAGVDALTDRMRRILEAESHLLVHADGSYTARAPLFAIPTTMPAEG